MRFEVYRSVDGFYRWRLRARNGKVLNDPYTRRRDAVRAAMAVRKGMKPSTEIRLMANEEPAPDKKAKRP